MQPSMFNLQVALAETNEVFLMNTFSDAQLLVSPDVAGLLDRTESGRAEFKPVLAEQDENAFGRCRKRRKCEFAGISHGDFLSKSSGRCPYGAARAVCKARSGSSHKPALAPPQNRLAGGAGSSPRINCLLCMFNGLPFRSHFVEASTA